MARSAFELIVEFVLESSVLYALAAVVVARSAFELAELARVVGWLRPRLVQVVLVTTGVVVVVVVAVVGRDIPYRYAMCRVEDERSGRHPPLPTVLVGAVGLVTPWHWLVLALVARWPGTVLVLHICWRDTSRPCNGLDRACPR